MNLFDRGRGGRPTARRRVPDLLFTWGTGTAALGAVSLVLIIAALLSWRSWATINEFGLRFLTGTTWDPVTGVFGAAPFIFGTLLTSGIAVLLGVPVSLGIATFLSEDAPAWLRTPLAALVELLAAVPSVVFGLWGIFVLAPIMRSQVEPGLHYWLGGVPWIGPAFSGPSGGADLLTAGVILAVMIIPTVSAISRESMSAVPRSQREAALALGATRWETTRTAVLPYASAGIIGAAILGLGRALGETMAVTMVAGNRDAIPTSLFSQGQTLASKIANQFTEAGPAELSALVEVGLVLLLITLLVNLVARVLVVRVTRGGGETGA